MNKAVSIANTPAVNDKIFSEFRTIFQNCHGLENNPTAVIEEYNHWNKRLTIADWDDMIKTNGGEISLFYGAIKLDIKNKGLNIRLPMYRGDLFNQHLNQVAMADEMFKTFVLDDNADSNIVALLIIGLIINCGKNGHGYVSSLGQPQYLEFLYLVLTNDTEYNTLVKGLTFNNKAYEEALQDYRNKFNCHFAEFKQRFIAALLKMYKVKETDLDNIKQVFSALDIKKSSISAGVAQIKFAKVEIGIIENTKELLGQITTIQEHAPELLKYYAYALYDQIPLLNHDLYQFTLNSKPAIELISSGNVNYTGFYEAINSKLLCRLLSKKEEILGEIPFEKINEQVDVLKALYQVTGVDNLNEDFIGEMGSIPASFSKSLALMAIVFASKKPDVNLDDLMKVIEITVKTQNHRNLVSILIYKFFYDKTKDVAGYAEHLAAIIVKLFELLLAVPSVEALSLHENALMNASDTLVQECLHNSESLKDFGKFQQNLTQSENLTDFIKQIRKYVGFSCIKNLWEAEKNQFHDRNITRPEQLNIDGVIFNSMNSWEAIYKFYEKGRIEDNFIFAADQFFYSEFGVYGSAYQVQWNGKDYLLLLNLCQSSLRKMQNNMFNHTFTLHSIADENEDTEAEIYKLAFKLTAHLNNI